MTFANVNIVKTILGRLKYTLPWDLRKGILE